MTDSTVICKFFVPGTPEPAGSKKSFVPLDKRLANDNWPRGMPYKDEFGRVIVNTVDANPRAKVWKEAVAWSAKFAFGGRALLDGPIAVDLVFCVERPKSHYGTGRNSLIVKNSAPLYPAVAPDVLKLSRAVEDAMSKVIYTDDSRIVSERIAKIYREPIGVFIAVREVSADDLQWNDGAVGFLSE
jgi:Holliday junction resolvase RusA-like endonuclease